MGSSPPSSGRGAVLGVGLPGLGEDAVHLGGDGPLGAVGRQRRVGCDLGPVDGDRAQGGEARLRARRQHVDEHGPHRLGVPRPEAGDSDVVGHHVGADGPEGEVAAARRLDAAGRPHAPAVGVDQQGEHHLGVVGRAAGPVVGVAGVERPQVDHGHDVEDEPHQVVLGQPVGDARGEEEELVPARYLVVISHRAL